MLQEHVVHNDAANDIGAELNERLPRLSRPAAQLREFVGEDVGKQALDLRPRHVEVIPIFFGKLFAMAFLALLECYGDALALVLNADIALVREH